MLLVIFVAFFVCHCSAAELVVGTAKNFTTIQSAIDAAAAGDRIIVDMGIYEEAITSKANGAFGQQITIESLAYLGAEIRGSQVLIEHEYIVLRGFKFTQISASNNEGAVTLKQAHNSLIEWCSFEKNKPLGLESSVLRVEDSQSAAIRANIFKENAFGNDITTSGSALHIIDNESQEIVGNQFDDSEVDVARNFGLKLENVQQASFRHNAFARRGYPEKAAALFADCMNLTVVDNFFGAPVWIADTKGADDVENHEFRDNTVSMNEQTNRGPNVALQTTGTRKITNVKFLNNAIVLCGDEQWLCADASCGGDGGGVESCEFKENVSSGEPDCVETSVPMAGNTFENNVEEPEPQALSLDALTGCNRLSGSKGSQTNAGQLPFVDCRASANQLFPFPYPTQPPTPAPTPPPNTFQSTQSTTAGSIMRETAPPTPPPTPIPPATQPSTTMGNMTNAPETTVSGGETAPLQTSDEGVSPFVILIMIGPLVLCSVIIGIMTGVAFCVRQKKLKKMQDSGGTRMEETWS